MDQKQDTSQPPQAPENPAESQTPPPASETPSAPTAETPAPGPEASTAPTPATPSSEKPEAPGEPGTPSEPTLANPTNASVTPGAKPPAGKLNIMPFVIIVIILALVLAGVGVYVYMKKPLVAHMQAVPHTMSKPTPTTAVQALPTISPVTAANVDQTLNTTDTKMQQTVNQANADLNSVNSIDTSQDNTSGF